MTRARIVALVVLVLAGCATTRPGDLSVVRASSDASRVGNVYLLRGWIGVFSTGINALTEKLDAEGVRAHVFQDDQWKRLAAAIRYERGGRSIAHEPLVLIGHSYGADDSIRIARELEKSGVRVDLLILMDPVTPPVVPANVRACRNYYQSNGAGDALPWFRGVPVKPAADFAGTLDNMDLRQDRTDLLEEKTNHFNIEKNGKLHAAIINDVLAACPRR